MNILKQLVVIVLVALLWATIKVARASDDSYLIQQFTDEWETYYVVPDMDMYYDYQRGEWVQVLIRDGDMVLTTEEDDGYSDD